MRLFRSASWPPRCTMTAEQMYELRVNRLGWTQEELGEALGTSGKQISRWERGLYRIPALEAALIEMACGAHVNMAGMAPGPRFYDLLKLIIARKSSPGSSAHLSPASRRPETIAA